jgi:hypothetical protein
MSLKPGQFIGTELPEGQRPVMVGEMMRMLRETPGMFEAVELAMKADQFEDGRPVGHYAALEVRSNTRTGRNIEKDNLMAEKVMREKERLAYG